MLFLSLFPEMGPVGIAASASVVLGLAVSPRLVLRVPLMMLFSAVLFLEFAVYFSVRLLVKICELVLTVRLFERKTLKKRMWRARSYEQWRAAAIELDKHEGREGWKDEAADRNYHCGILSAATRKLRRAREVGDVHQLVEVLRPCLVKNFAGVMNVEMYSTSNCGTKRLIEDYFDELENAILKLVELAGHEDEIVREVLRTFVTTAQLSYGRTSLLLSGGGSLGFYHLGIMRALLAEGLLPSVLCGTSAGALVLSFLASRTDEEALMELQGMEGMYANFGAEGGPFQGSWSQRLWSVFTTGHMYDVEHMEKHMAWVTQGMTFLEAYQKTGRIVNITCTPCKTTEVNGMPSMVCNHLTTPHVTLTSAVLASSCVPFFFPLVPLKEKLPDGTLRPYVPGGMQEDSLHQESLDALLMRDGSFQSDVPVQEMQSLFNANFHIVSQVNPHVMPLFFKPVGDVGRPVCWPWKKWRGGFFASLILSWLKEDMLKILRVMRDAEITFEFLGVDWSSLFLQESQGDVTFVPNVGLRDYMRVLDNISSVQELECKLQSSERSAWRAFAMIKNRTRAEQLLERLATAVRSLPGQCK